MTFILTKIISHDDAPDCVCVGVWGGVRCLCMKVYVCGVCGCVWGVYVGVCYL